MTEVHKVFVSYHHTNDWAYRTKFENMMRDRIVNWSVELGDIDPNLPDETIRQRIRDEYLRDSTVTVVLVGSQTWQRRHIDWEIGSSIRQTEYNPRSGLLGIMLPTYPHEPGRFNPCTIPPRLYDNYKCGYAKIYEWNGDPHVVQDWVHTAFLDRNNKLPDNSYPSYKRNHTGSSWC